MPLGNFGGFPGRAFKGISMGSKSKSVESDCLKYALVSKKTFDLKPDSFFAFLISSSVTTSCTPLISYNQIFGILYEYSLNNFNGS